MTDNHPITPPDELVMEWIKKHYGCRVHRDLGGVERTIATQAARWGADQELEACVKWLKEQRWEALAIHLRAARRPKPPSLKEQALKQVQTMEEYGALACNTRIIRQALEQLPD